MKATDKHRRAWRARWNRARLHARTVYELLELDAAQADSDQMAELRGAINDLVQCFHEASAYRTAHKNETQNG